MDIGSSPEPDCSHTDNQDGNGTSEMVGILEESGVGFCYPEKDRGKATGYFVLGIF